MRIIFRVALVLVAAAAQGFAQSLDEVEIVTTHVGGNIHQLEGRGGNIAVSAGDDGILIVDDQFAPLAEKIKAAVADIQQGSIAFLLNTHHHGDHTGGNAIFAKESVIVAQTGVRDRLSKANNHDPDALPIITFDESLSIHFNGEEIRMVHFPQVCCPAAESSAQRYEKPHCDASHIRSPRAGEDPRFPGVRHGSRHGWKSKILSPQVRFRPAGCHDLRAGVEPHSLLAMHVHVAKE